MSTMIDERADELDPHATPAYSASRPYFYASSDGEGESTIRIRASAASIYPALLQTNSVDRTVDATPAAGSAALVTYIFAAISSNEVSGRSEEHTSELQSHNAISYAVFCL